MTVKSIDGGLSCESLEQDSSFRIILKKVLIAIKKSLLRVGVNIVTKIYQ